MTGLWGTRISANVRRARCILLAAVGVLVVGGSSASAAQARSIIFGATLKQAPNVNFDCTLIPFAVAPQQINTPVCSWGEPTILGGGRGGLDVPATGIISQVKLRVGASTGRMRLVILRTLAPPNDPTSAQCCVLVARSSIFTPVRNGITTLKVNLPVTAGALGGVDVLDQVGLQILEDHVAIPLINETSLPILEQPANEYNTFTTLGTKQLAADPAGYELDMQATWNP